MKLVSPVVLLLSATVADAAGMHIISWTGNTRQSNSQLGVNELRVGCSGTPTACLGSLADAARAQGVDSVTLAINPDPAKIAAYAAEFSAASVKEPRLRGIGVDDFLSALTQWKGASSDAMEPAQLLRSAIGKTKSVNPKLEFGITLYEDQLSSPLLTAPLMPSDVRSMVDRVSLFCHFRRDCLGFAGYVHEVHALFPKATVVAGAYPYDRSDYLPCAHGSKEKCSAQQDKELFREALATQVSLLRSGEVGAIEFYPGNFGTEPQWNGWANPRACQPSRRQDCIDATVSMHQMVLQMLSH
jgi:hypothetical protein